MESTAAAALRDPPNHTLPGVPAPEAKRRKPVDSVTALGRISQRLALLDPERRSVVLGMLKTITPEPVQDAYDYSQRLLGQLSPADRAKVIRFLETSDAVGGAE